MSYSDQEAEAIFRRALAQQLEEQDGFGREELVAAAREIGLDEGAIDRAERQLTAEQAEQDIHDTVKRRQRDRWIRHAVAFVTAVGGLVAMNALALVGPWVLWIALIWAVLMAMHSVNVLRGPSESAIGRERKKRNRKARRIARARARAEARRQRREAERQRRRQREQQRRGKRTRDDELERLIEDGVTTLLGAAARRMQEAARRVDAEKRSPDTEFNRYVSRKKAESRGGGAAPGRRVRVEVAPDEREEAAEESARRARRTRGASR